MVVVIKFDNTSEVKLCSTSAIVVYLYYCGGTGDSLFVNKHTPAVIRI